MVAQVGGVLDPVGVAGHAVGLDRRGGLLGQLVEQPGELGVGELREAPDDGARRLVAHAGGRVAVRAQDAGRGRDDDRPGAGEPAQGVGVQRPGAAEGDEREVARVEALLHAHQAQRAQHVLVDDVDDARRGRLGAVEVGGVGDGLHRRARGSDVEVDLAAGQAARQVAEHDVGVGDGRLAAPPAPYAAGPGTAPADCGPTRSARVSGGTWAIEPPPAPTVRTSTEVARTLR